MGAQPGSGAPCCSQHCTCCASARLRDSCLENPGSWLNLRSRHHGVCCLLADRARGPGCERQGRPPAPSAFLLSVLELTTTAASATPRPACRRPWKTPVLAGAASCPCRAVRGSSGGFGLVFWFGACSSLFSIVFFRVTGWSGREDLCPAHSVCPCR